MCLSGTGACQAPSGTGVDNKWKPSFVLKQKQGQIVFSLQATECFLQPHSDQMFPSLLFLFSLSPMQTKTRSNLQPAEEELKP